MSFMPDDITSRTFLSFLPLLMLSEQSYIQHCCSGETPHLASRPFRSIVLSANTCSPMKHIWQHPLHHRCCFTEPHGPCYHITGPVCGPDELPGKWKFPSLLHYKELGWLTHKVAKSKKEIKYINNTVPPPRVLGVAGILTTKPAVCIIKSAEVANRWLELSRQRIWIILEARSGRRVISFRSTCSVFFSGLGSPRLLPTRYFWTA